MRGLLWRTRSARLTAAVATALALALGSAATLGSCASPKVRLNEGPRAYVPSDYDEALDTWTRSKELILLGKLENVLTATATFQSWDFRWAYAVRYADDYRLTIMQRSTMMAGNLEETRRRHSFYVAMYATRWKWSDLKIQGAAWTVRLVDDRGNETAPERIEQVRRPGAVDITYFPYTTPWRRVYRVSFPAENDKGAPTISPEAKWFGLRFAGAQGHDTLTWTLAEKP